MIFEIAYNKFMDLYDGDNVIRYCPIHYRESNKDFVLIYKNSRDLMYSTVVTKDEISVFTSNFFYVVFVRYRSYTYSHVSTVV